MRPVKAFACDMYISTTSSKEANNDEAKEELPSVIQAFGEKVVIVSMLHLITMSGNTGYAIFPLPTVLFSIYYGRNITL
jgi:hypothetical protein